METPTQRKKLTWSRLHWLLAVLAVSFVGLVTYNLTAGRHDDGVSAATLKAQADVRELALRLDGKFDGLSPDQRTKLIVLFGSEATAREEFGYMAHPPNGGGPPSR